MNFIACSPQCLSYLLCECVTNVFRSFAPPGWYRICHNLRSTRNSFNCNCMQGDTFQKKQKWATRVLVDRASEQPRIWQDKGSEQSATNAPQQPALSSTNRKPDKNWLLNSFRPSCPSKEAAVKRPARNKLFETRQKPTKTNTHSIDGPSSPTPPYQLTHPHQRQLSPTQQRRSMRK